LRSPVVNKQMELLNPSIWVIGVIGFVLAEAACGHAAPVVDKQAKASIQSKLDPELLRRLEELSSLGRLNEKLSVLIRTSSEINSDQENLLKNQGVIIRSKMGVILSAVIPAKSIQDVAALEFVRRIELARKLKERREQ
jgi:hypothetical protein